MQPPIARTVPHELEAHGDVRIDNYYWLRERENPDVIQYLEAENAYTGKMLAGVKGHAHQTGIVSGCAGIPGKR